MKVLQVIASISKLRGGTSTAIANFSVALNRLGILTDIATTDDDGPGKHLNIDCGTFSDAFGGRLIHFRKQTEFYSTSLPMFAWLRRQIRQYDLVHVHGLFNFSACAAAWSAKRANVPYVLTPHGTLDRWGRENRRPHIKRFSIAMVESRILKAASVVHFTSEIERSHAQELRLPFQSAVIPLGVDLSKIDDSVAADRPDDFPSDIGVKPTILFFSRVDLKKGLDILLDAFRDVRTKVPEAVLAIAGDGAPDLMQSLKQRTEALGISSKVHWLGFVSGDEKSWLLKHSSLFVLPSQSENFGLAVVEAMASRLPVIVSPGVALAELVSNSGAGEVCEANAQQLSTAIMGWLQNAERLRAAGESGRQLALQEISLGAFGKRLEKMYSNVLAASPVPN